MDAFAIPAGLMNFDPSSIEKQFNNMDSGDDVDDDELERELMQLNSNQNARPVKRPVKKPEKNIQVSSSITKN